MTLFNVVLIVTLICIHPAWTQKIRVSSFPHAPYLIENPDEGGYEGFIVDLLQAMGIDFEIKIPQDKKYGSYNENLQKWSGMMGMVANEEQEADMIAADLTITTQRIEALDFSLPFLTSDLTVLAKAGGVLENPVGLVFSPFTTGLWILVLLAYLITSLLYWLISRIVTKNESCITDSFWSIGSAFIFVSRPSPDHHSKRLIIFGWWIFAILVFASYAVTLAPLMTSNNNNAMFKYDSIDAMLQDPDFKFKTYPNGSTHSLLKNSEDEIHIQMNARLDFFKGKSGSNSILDGVRELEESQEANFGLVMEGTSAEYMLHDRCDFYTVGSLATRFYSFGLPKGSDKTENLSKKILELNENGAIQALKTKWWASDTSCSSGKSNQVKGLNVGIPQLGGALILLLVFLIVGLLVALYELFEEIKQDPSKGPLQLAIKQAFLGSPKPKNKSTKSKINEKVKEETEETLTNIEKQNGDNIA